MSNHIRAAAPQPLDQMQQYRMEEEIWTHRAFTQHLTSTTNTTEVQQLLEKLNRHFQVQAPGETWRLDETMDQYCQLFFKTMIHKE